MGKIMFVVKKSFINKKNQHVKTGDSLNPKDYDKKTIDLYKSKGMIVAPEKKPASPKETKKKAAKK